MQHLIYLGLFPADDLTLRPLVLGAGVVARALLNFIESRLDTKTVPTDHKDSEQSSDINFSRLGPYFTSGVKYDSDTNPDSAALEEHEEGEVSLAEAERKYKEAMESIAQLENEKSDLMSQVDTLRGSVQELSEKCTNHDEMRDSPTEDVIQLREEFSQAYMIVNTLLRDSPTEAEKRHEKAMETKTQLERKNKYLTSKVNALQEDLSLTRIKWKDAMREHEQAEVSLAEAERKYKEAMESIAQLENEKSDLMSQVDTLRGSVQEF